MVAKTRQVYPRVKQKKLAENIIQNLSRSKPLNAGELVASAGYSEKPARKHPGREIKAKGTQKALEEMGFSVFNAKRIIADILNVPIDVNAVTPDNQIRAAGEVFKTEGSYAPDKVEIKKIVASIQFNKPQ